LTKAPLYEVIRPGNCKNYQSILLRKFRGKPMTSDDEAPFKYLRIVTLRDAWSEVKATLLAWVLLSALYIGCGAFFDFSASKTASFWAILPSPAWWVIGFAAVSWVFRGQELRLLFPKSFRLWLLITSYVALMALLASILPGWTMLPIYAAAMLGYEMLLSLGRVGKENFDKLGSRPIEA
jgi:hypothetical protein